MTDRPYSFHGVGFSSRGEKGRFVLPPTFRKAVKEASGNARILCLNKHDRWPCLTGFGTSRRDFIPDQVDKEEAAAVARGAEFDRDLRFGQLSGFIDVPFDESGRFVFPDYLATLAGLDGAAFYNGNGPFFTIWNPAALAKMGAGFEAMQAACNALADEARGKRA
ncbi:division/cell wall cluster transcriptional repressor MraZ [Novosphingobium sp. Gsoil 351]|uniref:division/cell wall cluster transcriptional repressor MraZ n=1 Tax=Novosphingobium sp. Gsoil 351 TaxID=2675225 RepID=UPI0012B46AD7|nr:division/cell wall cluster transcriptional repressor MraZ [Novosphingobium sp. Gsoil 351]QGN55565.1 division/cell wall cluster transcriptional repressor MraZ [Novosphingobium sp. Gsoil 351]